MNQPMNAAAVPAHLGGHLNMTWQDTVVLDYLIERFGVKTMLDIGCGPGGMLDQAAARNIEAWGIDGDVTLTHPRIYHHDFATGPTDVSCYGRIDLVWSVEFLEHVYERFIGNYMAAFDAGKVAFITHALPGQGGHHHVNEKISSYWIGVFRRYGWRLDVGATVWVRSYGAVEFTRNTGMVFTKDRE